MTETSLLFLLHADRVRDPGPNRGQRAGRTSSASFLGRGADAVTTLGLSEVASAATAGIGRSAVPGGGSVDSRAVACLVVAAALWRLREDGVIAIEDASGIEIPAEWPKPSGPLEKLVTALKSDRSRGDLDLLEIGVSLERPGATRAGVEAAIVAVLTKQQDRRQLHVEEVSMHVVRLAMESASWGSNSRQAVIGLACDAGSETGVLAAAEGRRGIKLGGRSVKADPAGLEELAAEFEQAHAGWTRFCDDEHDLAAGVVEIVDRMFRGSETSGGTG